MNFAMDRIQLTRHVLFVSPWLDVSMSRIISGNIDLSRPVWKDGRNVPQSLHEKKEMHQPIQAVFPETLSPFFSAW